jgi:AraC family transcriptional regulator
LIELADHLVAYARVPGFEITEEVWEQGCVLHAHVHERPHMVVVFEGEFREHEVTGSRMMDGTSIIYFPPGLCHAVEFKQRTTLLSIEIEGDRTSMAQELFGSVPPGSLIPGTELFPLSLRIRDELRNKRRSSDVVLEALCLEFMAMASRLLETRSSSRVAPWLHDARKLIGEQYTKKLRLVDIATALGVSPMSLADGFRRAFDCSVGDFIRRKRVEHAIEMLVGSDVALGEIAIDAGFCDQSHFVRVFKAQTGMTPSRYRRNHASVAS